MTAKPRAKASTGRKTIGQSQERCDDAPGHESENMSSSECRTADFADDTDKSTKSHCDSSAISAQSAVKNLRDAVDLSKLPPLRPGWTWVVPADVCATVASGSTPKPTNMFSGNGEVPFLKVYNLTHTGLLDFTIKPTFISRATHEGMLGRSKAFPGDVLMNIVGPPLGKVSIVPDHIPETNINQAIVVFRVGPKLLSKYLAFSLLTNSVLGRLTAKAKATAGQSNIGVGMCRSQLPLPLAPLAEQSRIVAEIEKQFTRLDAGVAALKRVQANLKRYRAAVLKAACEGRLVPTEAELRKDEGRRMNDETKRAKPGGSTSSSIPHTPSFESGEALLARILTERRQNCQGRGKYKEPLLPDSDYLGPVPDGWAVGSISQIAECLDGRRVPINKGERLKRLGDIPYYGANGRVGWIDNHLFDETLVLVVEDETFVGRTLPFSYLIHGKSWVNNHAHILRATSAVQPAYLNYALAYYPFTARTTGSTGRRKLTQQALMTAPFALPPLAEQTRIVAEVERRLSVVEELEAVVSANLQRATRLRQSILQKAFTGELV